MRVRSSSGRSWRSSSPGVGASRCSGPTRTGCSMATRPASSCGPPWAATPRSTRRSPSEEAYTLTARDRDRVACRASGGGRERGRQPQGGRCGCAPLSQYWFGSTSRSRPARSWRTRATTPPTSWPSTRTATSTSPAATTRRYELDGHPRRPPVRRSSRDRRRRAPQSLSIDEPRALVDGRVLVRFLTWVRLSWLASAGFPDGWGVETYRPLVPRGAPPDPSHRRPTRPGPPAYPETVRTRGTAPLALITVPVAVTERLRTGPCVTCRRPERCRCLGPRHPGREPGGRGAAGRWWMGPAGGGAQRRRMVSPPGRFPGARRPAGASGTEHGRTKRKAQLSAEPAFHSANGTFQSP